MTVPASPLDLPKTSNDAPFVINHLFNAPLELVWQVYTQPEHLRQWMRPAGLSDAGSSLDLRVGGVFHYGMGTPDGKVMWGKWTFLAIEPPRQGVAKMVVVVSFSDAQQSVTRHPMAADWPLQTLSSSTYTAEGAEGSQTRLRLLLQACNATDVEQATFNAGHASMAQGWGGTLKMLEAYLQKIQTG